MKSRTLLGLLCILSALIFMVHSFLEPKSHLLIKPSGMEKMGDLGYYMYRQLIPKLADESDFVFYIEDLSRDIPVVLAFMEYGKESDSRKYEIFSNIEGLQALSQEYPVKEIPSSFEVNEEEEITRIFLFSKKIPTPKLKNQWNTYYFYSYPISSKITDFQCSSWKDAFLLKSEESYTCFAKKHLRKFEKEVRKSKGHKFFTAFEMINSNHYIFYHSTREAWDVDAL